MTSKKQLASMNDEKLAPHAGLSHLLCSRGTFSIVKRATDKRSGEEVAIKIINKDQVAKTHQEDLLREMKILTKGEP